MCHALFAGIILGIASLLDSSMMIAPFEDACEVAEENRKSVASVACPLCGRCVPYPALTRRGVLSLAECDDCDIYFDAQSIGLDRLGGAGSLAHRATREQRCP
jgi:hypothetical protein